jgi:hypothetical protein
VAVVVFAFVFFISSCSGTAIDTISSMVTIEGVAGSDFVLTRLRSSSFSFSFFLVVARRSDECLVALDDRCLEVRSRLFELRLRSLPEVPSLLELLVLDDERFRSLLLARRCSCVSFSSLERVGFSEDDADLEEDTCIRTSSPPFLVFDDERFRSLLRAR